MRMEELLYEFEMTPEEQRAEQEEWKQEQAARKAQRARQEGVWEARHTAEWDEWVRVRLLLNGPIPFGDEPFDFDDFLREVGRCPSPKHEVVRSNESEPYQQGNLSWAAKTPEPLLSPYLNVEQAAAYLGVAKRTVYNNRRHIPALPGFRTLMFDPKVLDQVRSDARFMSKRRSSPR
jgi:hypothetical protein